MAAYWNLTCVDCEQIFANVACSMYDIPKCPQCGGERRLSTSRMLTLGTGIFPFTLPHVDGQPMEIRSMSHLREVEKTYGVAFSAFNKSNVNDLDPLSSVPVYRGDEPDFRGRRR